MKAILLAGLAGMAIGVALGARPEGVWGFYNEIYPSDPVHRWALNECSVREQGFNRLDPAARETCYRQTALASAASSEPLRQQAQLRGNFVDLWRSAGQGRLPQNDVRAEERNRHYLEPPAVAASRTASVIARPQ